MSDGLLTGSVVRLFGRKIDGVPVTKNGLKKATTNKRLHDALGKLQGDLRLARIYAFSFEGQFHTLPKPTIFLVDDGSQDTGKDTGLASKGNVTLEKDIEVWTYDKDDVMLRADIVIGTVDDVLIDATLSPTAKYPIISRAGTPQEASWRDGQMIQRNRLQ